MICYECGAEMRKTSEPIMEVVRGVETCVDGIPHWQCDACGNNAMEVEDATILSRAQFAQAGVALPPVSERGVQSPQRQPRGGRHGVPDR